MLNTVYSYGGGEALQAIFNGIAMLFNNGLSKSIISVMTAIAVTWAGIQTILEGHYKSQVKWIVRYVIILDLLILPQSSINIRDVISNKVYKIDNLPIGLTIPAGLISGMGFAITTEFESVFSTVDYLPYHKFGTVFGAQVMSEARNFKIQDPVFRENMESFIDNCVMYDVMIGHKYTISELKGSNNIWELISTNASNIRMFNYRENNSGRELTTCKNGVQKLENYWNKDFIALEKKLPLISRLTSSSASGALSQVFANNINAVLSFYGSKQTGAQDTLKQLMVINAIADVPMSYGTIRAGQQQKESWIIAGELAKQNLPIMHSVFEALIYASFILVFGLMILPGGFRIAGTYFGMMMWIQLWPPLFAVLNLIINTFNKAQVKGLISDGITMSNVVSIANSGSLAAATAGGLGIFIPVISYMIVKGGAAQFVHIAGQLTSASQSASSSVANEVTSGNRNFDNVSLANQAFMSQSGFKTDLNTAVKQGHMEYTMQDGTIVKEMPGGSAIMQGGAGITSSTGTKSFRQSDVESAQLHQQKGYEQSLLDSVQKEYSDSTQFTNRTAVDLVAKIAKGEASGEHYEYGKSTSDGRLFSNIIDKTRDYHENHNLSWQQSAEAAINGAASINGSIGIGGRSVGAGVNVGISGGANAKSSADQSYGESRGVSSRGSSNETTEAVVRASKNINYSENQSSEKALTDQLSTSYDKMQQSREAVSVHKQNVDRIQNNIDKTQAVSFAIDEDHYQDFINFVAKQPNQYNRPIGAVQAYKIAEQGGDLFHKYAKQYQSSSLAGAETMKQVNHFRNTPAISYEDRAQVIPEVRNTVSNARNDFKANLGEVRMSSTPKLKYEKSEKQNDEHMEQMKQKNILEKDRIKDKVDYYEDKRLLAGYIGLKKEKVEN